MTALQTTALLVAASLAAACANDASGRLAPDEGTPASGEPAPAVNQGDSQTPGTAGRKFEPTAEQAAMYLQYIGPTLVGRTMNDGELERVAASAAGAVRPILEGWFTDPGFAEAVRGMMELKLSASGKSGEADFNLAGYLVRHVVQHQMPWSTIVTSPTCYDADDAAIPCDTGAPYTAGVLTTRGFLAGNEGRFNLSRAHTMLKTFMCRDYPHETELQPPVDKMQLKVMFRAANAQEQQVAEAAGGFGNGLACYACHGQFSLHAQPFVKFDKTGLYLPDADGLQNPDGQLGEGKDGTAASHWEEAELAKQESATWFGTPVANLAEAGRVLGEHEKFRECTLQHVLDLAIGLSPSHDVGIKGLKVDPLFLRDIAAAVEAANPDPSLQELAAELLSDARVIATALEGMRR